MQQRKKGSEERNSMIAERFATNNWDRALLEVHGEEAWEKAMQLAEEDWKEQIPDLNKLSMILSGEMEKWIRSQAALHYERLFSNQRFCQINGTPWEEVAE